MNFPPRRGSVRIDPMQPSRVRCLFLVSVFLLSSLSLIHAQRKSFDELKIAAEAGDPVAQMEFAVRLSPTSPEYEIWLRKAAKQHYPPAQGKLGQNLLNRARTEFKLPQEAVAEIGMEAQLWSTRAATQGDQQGKANLALIYLEGWYAKGDLVQAYKWGELAAQSGTNNLAGSLGQSCRDRAAQKMTSEQIEEARELIAEFKPTRPEGFAFAPPPPIVYSDLTLKGISGSGNRRFAMINDQTFSPGDQLPVKVADKKLKVRCIEIRERSVIVTIEGEEGQKELAVEAKPTADTAR
jgi:TPR repeat protein